MRAMDFMEWALHTATNHPDLRNSFVTANDQWLDILLHDGRAFRFRPGALINENSPLELRTELLNRLISIGITNATSPAAEPSSEFPPKSESRKHSAQTRDLPPSEKASHLQTEKIEDENDADSTKNQRQNSFSEAFAQTFTSSNTETTSKETDLGDNPDDSATSVAGHSHNLSEEINHSEEANSVFDTNFANQTNNIFSTDAPGTKSFSFDPNLSECSSYESDWNVENSSVFDSDSILPIVRNAAYFLRSHNGDDSMVYIPLTDFIAAGIAQDNLKTISPIYYSQLTDDFREIGEILSESVSELRNIVDTIDQTLRLDVMRIAGANVISFSEPMNYESSWFADLELIQQLTARISTDQRDSLFLFVPASRTKFYIVREDDPNLADFFKELLATSDSPEAIYPLPHTVAADGWREWIPFPGSPLAEILGALRGKFRQAIYAEQVRQMLTWGDFGALKSYDPKVLRNGERVSNTIWRNTDGVGSVPDTDFITFIREPSPHPWENAPSVKFSIRTHIAREIWGEGIKLAENIWPPRWEITGFPDDETLTKLREASTREF